jgi:uncharacterized membrane protein
MTRFKQFWLGIKNSFWFVPALIVFALTLLAIEIVETDKYLVISEKDLPIPWSSFEPESVRTFLATIAGSMMTIAGVIFSITILVLAQTASQYTSRVLRNFMKNRSNQVVLGIFVGIFVFCLFSITMLHPKDNILTALSGLFLAIIGVGFLVHYIHQISISIQASEILRNVYNETTTAIKNQYLEREINDHDRVFVLENRIYTRDVGFLQAIDTNALQQLAHDYETKIQIPNFIGDFISLGDPIGLTEKDLHEDETFCNRFYRALIIGKYRTLESDPLYGIQQITDISLRGLTSSYNDITTVQTAIGYLTSLYVQLANRQFGPSYYYENDQPQLGVAAPDFALFLHKGFGIICLEAKRFPYIQTQIADSLKKIKEITTDTERQTLLENALQNVCK